MVYPQIILKKGKDVSVFRKHPWIFSGAIHKTARGVSNGDIVEVLSAEGDYLATGHWQSGTSIAIRILTFNRCAIDSDFWTTSLGSAAGYRRAMGLPCSDTDAYRLIHGEGDGLPGLVIDVYNDIAVIQCHSAGMYKSSGDISDGLKKVLGGSLNTIYLRSRDTLPENPGKVADDSFLYGKKEETLMTENGVTFRINVVTGQKTGFFLDQRENRHLLSAFANGKTVLNCFCYTGGFSLYALKAGATYVESVDISQQAMTLLEENLSLNTYNGEHKSVCANVLHYLGDADTELYDIVVVDPPAFAKSLHKRHNAVQAYKRLNVLALKKVKSGGLLFTFSCSQVVGTQLFYDTIIAAGIESGRAVRVVRSLSQGPDHPVNLFHPEGHYLKGLVLFVE